MLQTVCVKVDILRALGYNSIKDWCEYSPQTHILATRSGRVFIDGTPYHYKGSTTWANHDKMTMDEYTRYIRYQHYDKLPSLCGKIIGCFCYDAILPPPSILTECVCHTQVLYYLWRECMGLSPPPIIPQPCYDSIVCIYPDDGKSKYITCIVECDEDVYNRSIVRYSNGVRINKTSLLRGRSKKYPIILPSNHVEYTPWTVCAIKAT